MLNIDDIFENAIERAGITVSNTKDLVKLYNKVEMDGCEDIRIENLTNLFSEDLSVSEAAAAKIKDDIWTALDYYEEDLK